MSRIITEILETNLYEFEFKRFWTDSFTVLYWLFSQSSRFKPFVSTRIQEFQDSHVSWRDEIRYVPSDLNPADCLTKVISTDQLSLWHQGRFHNFIELEEELWPSKVEFDEIDVDAIDGN